jgi:hypothetical protein
LFSPLRGLDENNVALVTLCTLPPAVTEREAKDDLKVIRAKAPPPTVSELCNPYRYPSPAFSNQERAAEHSQDVSFEFF